MPTDPTPQRPVPRRRTTQQQAREFVRRWEQGRANWPAALGGETNQGITQSRIDEDARLRRRPVQHTPNSLPQGEIDRMWNTDWERSGAAELEAMGRPDLAIAHYDTYALSPGKADTALERSRGDLHRYLRVREVLFNRQADRNRARGVRPDTKRGWQNRTRDLARETMPLNPESPVRKMELARALEEALTNQP